jgi:hypothetical protein
MHKIALPLVLALLTVSAGHSGEPSVDWAINATAIEACSCPHFCMCYFNSHPATHHENGKTEHFCKFNNAYKVNRGHYGDVNLAGAKFWLSGDLGEDFSKGQMDWALATFDKETTAEQRQALAARRYFRSRVSSEVESRSRPRSAPLIPGRSTKTTRMPRWTAVRRRRSS